MIVRRHETPQEIAALAADWNRLAGSHPFRSWEWLGAWWETYGAGQLESFAISVTDPFGKVVLIAPWWIDATIARGRLVRFWGDNEVCSDHQSLLVNETHAPAAIAALADWLVSSTLDGSTSSGGMSNHWDALELGGVLASDPWIPALADQLAAKACSIHTLAGPSTWLIDFSEDWEEYLKRLSSDRRREARRAYDRWIPTGNARYTIASTPDDLKTAWPIFVDLHQKRRISLKQPGCFASAPFGVFLAKAVERLAERGMLRLNLLSIEGRPAATNLSFTSGDWVYAYQMGMEPEFSRLEPGKILAQAMLRAAFERGIRHWDFLRGDEPYKGHLRAVPTPQITLQAVAPAALAQVRSSVWSAGQQVKDWIKTGLSIAGLR